MKSIRTYTTLIVFALLALFIACTKNDFKVNISNHDSDESHYTGENCMRCHYSAGSADGSFSMAGSVFYSTEKKLTVKAYDDNGTLLASVPIDQLGNLHTTDAIDFSQGVLIEIHDKNDIFFSSMDTKIYTGECNLCHDGSYEPKIGDF